MQCPPPDVAVFVGTEFDPIAGRGGVDGTPVRKTPWGEIAFQLGGERALRFWRSMRSKAWLRVAT